VEALGAGGGAWDCVGSRAGKPSRVCPARAPQLLAATELLWLTLRCEGPNAGELGRCGGAPLLLDLLARAAAALPAAAPPTHAAARLATATTRALAAMAAATDARSALTAAVSAPPPASDPAAANDDASGSASPLAALSGSLLHVALLQRCDEAADAALAAAGCLAAQPGLAAALLVPRWLAALLAAALGFDATLPPEAQVRGRSRRPGLQVGTAAASPVLVLWMQLHSSSQDSSSGQHVAARALAHPLTLPSVACAPPHRPRSLHRSARRR
jgi:hypothetical protein